MFIPDKSEDTPEKWEGCSSFNMLNWPKRNMRATKLLKVTQEWLVPDTAHYILTRCSVTQMVKPEQMLFRKFTVDFSRIQSACHQRATTINKSGMSRSRLCMLFTEKPILRHAIIVVQCACCFSYPFSVKSIHSLDLAMPLLLMVFACWWHALWILLKSAVSLRNSICSGLTTWVPLHLVSI